MTLAHSSLWIIITKTHLVVVLDSFQRVTLIFVIYSSITTNLGRFIFPVAWVGTLRLREVKRLAPGHAAGSRRIRSPVQVQFPSPSPMPPTNAPHIPTCTLSTDLRLLHSLCSPYSTALCVNCIVFNICSVSWIKGWGSMTGSYSFKLGKEGITV